MDTEKELSPSVVERSTKPVKREAWGNSIEFFLSCLSYAVGFGNVWRFPFLCYKNGGAAFLIPYAIMFVVAGLPLFFMELALGQYASFGPSVLFANMAPILTGLGYAMLMICFFITVHYNILLAWSIFYFISSFNTVLPWSHCENDYNSLGCHSPELSMSCYKQNLTVFNNTCIEFEMFCQQTQEAGYNIPTCFKCATYECLASNEMLRNFTQEFKEAFPPVSPAEDYFKNRVLGVTGTTWENMGSFRWELVGCLALGWGLIALCLIKGIKSSGKVIYVTATLPYVILLIFLIRGLTLPGSYNGLEYFLFKPDLSKIFDIESWNDAASQIFYSLGSSCGVLITLASYNPLKNNCLRDALVVAVCNSLTSIFAGSVIFSVLGFIAHELEVPISEVISSGSGLAFVAFPAALSVMPGSWFWSILFFGMLISLGIGSQFAYVETLASSVYDQFEGLRKYRPILSFVMAFVLFLCGLTMCLEGGAYMLELFVWYSSGMSLLVLGLIEVLAIHHIYGFRTVMKIIQEDIGVHMPTFLYGYFTVTWLFATPVSLAVISGFSLYFFTPAYYGTYHFPYSIQVLGWFMCCSSIAMIPLGSAWAVWKHRGQDWRKLFQQTPSMCPASERHAKFHGEASSINPGITMENLHR